MLRRSLLPALFLVACTSLYADVTQRMSFGFKINVALPGPVPQLPFNEILTRIKGDHGYAAIGPIIVITDISTGKITLLDPKAQRFATVAMADYLSKLKGTATPDAQNMPEQAKEVLAKIKFDADSRDTGRTDRIQGIDVYEREVVVHMSIPVPLPGQENGVQIEIRFQVWKPKPSEFERVPALKELAAYNERNKGFGDPSTVLRQAFGTLPGMGDKVAKMAEEITKGGNVTLGMHLGIFVPGLAKILAQTGAQGLPALPPDDKPLVEVNLDLKELSSDKVADDVFTTPAGYKEAPIEDVVKGMTNALTGAKAAEPQPAELKPAALELRVEPKGTDFLLTWNKDCAVITNSIQGGLSITDGGRHVHYDMGPSQLKSGSIVYTPVASDVSFELEVTGADGSKTVRRIRTRTEPSPASPSK